MKWPLNRVKPPPRHTPNNEWSVSTISLVLSPSHHDAPCLLQLIITGAICNLQFTGPEQKPLQGVTVLSKSPPPPTPRALTLFHSRLFHRIKFIFN